MIFPILVLILVGVIAYFHYVEGLFSATISAFCAVLAAVIAFSYHETIIFTLLKGKVANYAHAMVLVALFALAYLVLRVIFDKAIPGNVRFPLYVDRVGGAVMGIIAGIFATGILAIAAASLPFDQGAPYARFPLAEDVDVTVGSGGGSQAQDAKVRAALDEPEPGRFNANTEAGSGMILPVDDIVVNLVSKLSTGALAGKQPLAAVHPNYLDEVFASRLGIQTGAGRVAINTDETKQFNVAGVYTIDQIAQADAELESVRNRKAIKGVEAPLRKPAPSDVLLIVRGQFTRGAHDKDNNVRFSPASVRLVAAGKNHIPIGTIDTAGVLRVNLPDDFLVAPGDASIDFVFQVPREDFGLQPAPTRARAAAAGEGESAQKLADGVFIEAKRMGVVDLSGRSLDAYPGPLDATVHQKRGVPEPKAPGATGAGAPVGGAAAGAGAGAGAAPADATASPIVFGKAEVSTKLFTPVNVAGDGDGEKTFPSGSANLRDGKIAKLDVNMTQTVELLSRGDYARDEFYVPPGMKMVQVSGTAPPKAPPEPWDWADKLAQFELVDANGTKYKPNGAWAKVKGAQGSNRMVARYEAESQVSDVSHEEGRPTDVWIAFLVPEGTQLAELQFEGKRVAAVDQKVE
jgi:hypothetical protein